MNCGELIILVFVHLEIYLGHNCVADKKTTKN